MSEPTHDLFLSYNSKDRAAVERLERDLLARGVRVWIDSREIAAGDPVQERLEKALESGVRAVAIVVGASGLGRWQEEEVRYAADLAVQKRVRAFYVRLADGVAPEGLPGFLRLRHYVDLGRMSWTEGLNAIRRGITGEQGEPEGASVAAGLASPFVVDRPIAFDGDFFGRQQECGELLRALGQGRSIQLLGERRMGKSSLLRWVERHLRQVPLDWPVVRLSARDATLRGPLEFMEQVAQLHPNAEAKGRALLALARPGEGTVLAASALTALCPLVLLVDDADRLAEPERAYDREFLEHARTLGEAGRFIWVSASRENLYDAMVSKVSSSFLNNACVVPVGALAPPAAAELIARGGISEADQAWALKLAGPLAHGLQYLGEQLSHGGSGLHEVQARYESRMRGTFRVWWQGMGAEEQQVMLRCAAAEAGVDGPSLLPREQARAYAMTDRGLLVQGEGRLQPVAGAWRRFVLEQR